MKPSTAIDTDDKVYLENYKHPEIELAYLACFGIRHSKPIKLQFDM